MNSLPSGEASWLSMIPDLHVRLQADPPSRVADIACADGFFSIALAQLYPKIRIDGFDVDEVLIGLAWSHVYKAGLIDRLTFHVRDVGDATLNGRYDLCIAAHGIHRVRNPVGVLATMRRLAGERGSVLVTEPNASDSLTDAGSEMDSRRSADLFHSYASSAGFYTFEVLPVGDTSVQCFRLYS